MARKAVLLLLLVAASALVAASDDPTVSLSGVVDLTPENFDTIVNGKTSVLIEFYAPWCGHCKKLVPEYARLGAAVTSDPKLKSRVVIAKVDADKHRSLGERFGVRGFPSLKWFPRGKPTAPEDYNGGRTVDAFLAHIKDTLAADSGFARVDALVPLAQRFLTSEPADQKALLKDAEGVAATAAEDDKASAALYVRYMGKALEKGSAYINGELARLEKLAEKGMSAAKMDEISRKISVLSSFIEVEQEAAKLLSSDPADDEEEDIDEE